MINTAIEAAIDVATTAFDPMAKLAKDIAAGAVLIATVNAVAVGYLVFAGAGRDRRRGVLDRRRDAPAEMTIVALVLAGHRRDRGQGVDGARHAAAGRAALRHAASRSPGGWR